MKRFLILLMSVLLFSYEYDLFACRCIDPETIPIDQALYKSTAVFIGEVVAIENAGSQLNIKFDVLTSYKGITEKAFIIVKTSRDASACGFPFNVGERYLVFTYGKDAFYTSICTKTQPLSKAIDLLEALPKPIFSTIKETDTYADNAKKIDALLKQIEKELTKYKDESLLIKIKDARILLRDYSTQTAPGTKESKCPIIGCPPCPPCPEISQHGQSDQINEQDFSNFFNEYKKASTDKDKLRLLESLLTSGSYLSVSQIIPLLKQLDFSSNRKSFFKTIKGHISDLQNIYQIYNHLDFQSEKDEAERILEGK